MKIGQKYIIGKQSMLDLLDLCKKEFEIIAPTKMSDGEVSFESIASSAEITFDYVNEMAPLKRFLFPAHEDLFRFRIHNGKPELEIPAQPKPFLLFGVRSCDVQGFAHMDSFFSGTFNDNYYWQRRNKMTVISMACNQPLDTCFCVCCNGGPFLDSGFDLQLTDFGNTFLVDIGSENGIEILNKHKSPLSEATQDDEDHRLALMQACDEQMIPTAYLAKAIINITNNRVKEELWEQMGAECFSCGGCTHVCPLCTCFDVHDIHNENSGVRSRCWDSCQYSGYTHEASGHNPRSKAKERVKRRFYHKLSYAYVKQDGHPGCVGCGRCITVCEAFNLLDIAAVVKRLRRGDLYKSSNKILETTPA